MVRAVPDGYILSRMDNEKHRRGVRFALVGVLGISVLAGLAGGGYALAIGWALISALGDEAKKPLNAAMETLSCPRDQIQLQDAVAKGCGRECHIETAGSSSSWFSSYVCTTRPPVP